MAIDGELLARVGNLLGTPVTSLGGLEGGSGSRVFAVQAAGRSLVVKVSADESVARNAVETLQLLATIGVPVPEVVAHDTDLVVMSLVPGRDLGRVLSGLSRRQLTSLAGRVVAIQRLVATLPSPAGCGFVGVHEVATRSWPDVVRHPGARPLAYPLPADCENLVARLHAVIDLAEQFWRWWSRHASSTT